MHPSNEQLIEKARSVIRPRKLKSGFTIGDVGCALITDKRSGFLGTCIDTSSGMGFCAEHSAISAMVTHGEQRIKKIVAVSKEERFSHLAGDVENSSTKSMRKICKRASFSD